MSTTQTATIDELLELERQLASAEWIRILSFNPATLSITWVLR